jgi:hypothetical protein
MYPPDVDVAHPLTPVITEVIALSHVEKEFVPAPPPPA